MALLNHKVEVNILCVGTCSEIGVYFRKRSQGIASEDGSHLVEGHIGGNQTTTHQEGNLHHVSPSHRSQTTIDGIDTSYNEEAEDDQHADADFKSEDADGQALETENLLNGQSTEPGYGCEVHKDIEEQPQDGEGQTYAVVIALAEELRDGEDLTIEHHGEQELTDDHECDGGHHLIGCNGDTVAETCSRHTDELFCRNIGGNQRGSDGPPGQRVSSQEVVIGTLFLAVLVAAEEESEADQKDKVTNEDDEVNGFKTRRR